MKPRLVRTPGVPGYSLPEWWCYGAGGIGMAGTAGDAYIQWLESRVNADATWIQQPPPKPLTRLQRWVLQCGDWR